MLEMDFVLGIRVHDLVVRSGYQSNSFLANHITCMSASHGRLENAVCVFSKVATLNRYMWPPSFWRMHGMARLSGP